jgi:hypothetical protein
MFVECLAMERWQIEGDRISSSLRFAEKVVSGEVIFRESDKFGIGNPTFVRENLRMYIVAKMLNTDFIEPR